MYDSFQNDSRQSGVTIAELLVVIVIISVIAGFALVQRGGTDEKLKRQNSAQELKIAFERARFDSVKRRADTSDIRANVVVNTSGFTLSTDSNQDGVLDSTDERVVDLSGSNIVIGGDVGMSFPVTVSFDQRGEATATDSTGDTEPVFWVCNVSCSTPDGSNSNIVLITPTGTVNLLPGGDGSAIPTFSPPAGITVVPAGNSINNQAAVTPTP